MTQATETRRRSVSGPERRVPSHPHYTLGTLVTLGVLGTLVALGLAIGALMITASRDSVDDGLVSERVDEYLAGVGSTDGAMSGVLPVIVPKSEMSLAPAGEVNVSTAPAVPPAATRSTPAIVHVEFEIVEGVNTIDLTNGMRVETWGYRVVGADESIVAGTPGPLIRARVGDVLRFTITNPESSTHPHNVDFHAVTGQGGGAEATTVAPGESVTVEARLLYPGLFMYHCAYGDVPAHIAHGMYGGILVDPEIPLPTVDHEWYMVQSEFFTTESSGGMAEFDRQRITDEDPSHVVFNGAVGALAGDNALQMRVGERARIYFVNAGLNLDSNFHPIGSHWDVVYPEAALLGTPLRGSQTTLVPAGGGTVVELIGQVPSTIILVDHALARAFDKGAVGQIVVTGEVQPEIFEVIEGETEEPTPTTAAPEEGEAVTILPGSGEAQSLDSPDEFAASESPADYSVNVLTIGVGTTVTWINTDAMLHTVTALNGEFDSGFLGEGDSWSHTFTEPGEYEYYCLPHPWMRAKVVVEP